VTGSESISLDVAVGDNIRHVREHRGLTQRAVSERLAEMGWTIDPTAITRIESGQRELRVNQLALVARALGVTPGSLLISDAERVKTLHRLGIDKLREAHVAVLSALAAFDMALTAYKRGETYPYWEGALELAPTREGYLTMVAETVRGARAEWARLAGFEPSAVYSPRTAPLVQAVLNEVVDNVFLVEEDGL